MYVLSRTDAAEDMTPYYDIQFYSETKLRYGFYLKVVKYHYARLIGASSKSELDTKRGRYTNAALE